MSTTLYDSLVVIKLKFNIHVVSNVYQVNNMVLRKSQFLNACALDIKRNSIRY